MSPQERGAHTPGPWYFYSHKPYDSAPERFAIAQEDGAPYTPNFSDVAEMVSSEKLEIQEANARLIAAVPDYHEEVGRILAEHDEEAQARNFSRCGCPVCKSLRPIHAKATGTQP